MKKIYVDRCLCGYSLTQEELDAGECPECERPLFQLSDRWEAYEEQQIERSQTDEKRGGK